MKRRGKIWFFVVAIMILFLAYSTTFGISNRYGDIETPIVKSASEISFGIDIRGGVDVTFVPSVEDVTATQEQLDAAQAVVEQRLLGMNVTDFELYQDVGKGSLILRFPWSENETEFDPQAAIEELGTAAVLTFREGAEPDLEQDDNIILEGNDVTSANAMYGPVDASGVSQNYVELNLSEEGQQKFAEATARLVSESQASDTGEEAVISIWLDGQLISSPSVNEAIDSQTATITSENFDSVYAKQLADTINAGSLPFALTAESYSTISPALGSQALRAMVIAGILAFIFIAFFMVFNYRLLGVVSIFSLLGQVMGTIALISGYFVVFPSFTLTLPGIAGIILAIGMGVDANVITAERIREEIRSGKKLDPALKAGFKRGLSPIIDGNVTVIIVAAILMGAFGPTDSFFGMLFRPLFFAFGPATAGTIYSFGYTLLVGVLLNFVFGVLANRAMITSLSKFKRLRSPVLYGGVPKGKTAPPVGSLNIVGKRKHWFYFSGVILAFIVVFSVVFGVKMDVQFSGGAIVTYAHQSSVDAQVVQELATDVLGEGIQVQEGENIATGSKTITLTTSGGETIEAEKLETLTEQLNERYPIAYFQQLSANNVDPSIGQTFLVKCIVAVLAASLLILAYVAIRFRRIGGWRGGITAVVALVHDLIIVYGVFVVFGIPLNGNFIAALLVILGYSINDTVVVYDRVRENRTLYGKNKPFGELVNLSINQSMRRSLNTTFTTLVALGCVCIFSLVFGLDSLLTFAFPLMIGMISGVYSTMFIAGPLWVSWNNRLEKKNSEGKTADEKQNKTEKALPEAKSEAAEEDAKEAEQELSEVEDASESDEEAAETDEKPDAEDAEESKDEK